MRNFTSLGVFPATYCICIIQVISVLRSLPNSSQVKFTNNEGCTGIQLRGQATFAGATNSPLIVIDTLPPYQGAPGTNGTDSSTNTLTKTLLTKTLPMTNTTQPKT